MPAPTKGARLGGSPAHERMIIAGLATLCAMALIWYIWWLALLSFVGVLAAAIWHTFNYDRDYYVPAEEVRETEEARDRALAAQGA